MSSFEERRKKIADGIPESYNPYLHAFIPSAIGWIVIVLSIYGMSYVTLLSLLWIPITIFVLFGFEWLVHRYVLHRRTFLLETIYEKHELAHHIMFTDKTMDIKEKKELYLILMPHYAVVLLFLMMLPNTLLLNFLISTNVALIVLATAMFFFLWYEWLHFAYHLPEDHFISKLRIIQWLKEHHRRHHDPRLMKRWNFNVTVPVFDWILGTKYHEIQDRR